MKGLIIKDLMCLRKQRIIFIYVVVATIVLSIMFVLSAKFGNIYTASQEMINDMENGLGSIEVDLLANMAMILFMLCPLAIAGEVTNVFIYDGKAGFANVSSSLPLSIGKKVLAKFIAAFSMLGIGVIIDILISFVLSLLTENVSFIEFFGIIIFAASIMLIYGTVTIFFCFCLGYGKEGYAQFISLVLILAAYVIPNFSKIKYWFLANDEDYLNITSNVFEFIKNKSYITFGIAVVTLLISYFGTVTVAKRKRGMI